MARNAGKIFAIEFAAAAHALPMHLRARAREILRGVADSLKGIPESSALWREMDAGNAELNLAGWHFEYRIDHHDRRIVVVEARKVQA
jgi:predicted TIM-barrel fold metal-dependent hydrolase